MGPEWIGFVTAVIAAIIAAVSQIMLFQFRSRAEKELEYLRVQFKQFEEIDKWNKVQVWGELSRTTWGEHSLTIGVPEGVVHGESLGLASGDQRIITGHIGDGHPFLLLSHRFLQLETAGQVNRIKSA